MGWGRRSPRDLAGSYTGTSTPIMSSWIRARIQRIADLHVARRGITLCNVGLVGRLLVCLDGVSQDRTGLSRAAGLFLQEYLSRQPVDLLPTIRVYHAMECLDHIFRWFRRRRASRFVVADRLLERAEQVLRPQNGAY